MSIATEKEKHASQRFLLVRLNPARYFLPVLNAGLYELVMPVTLNKIERNGVMLTKVSGTPAVNDEWSQDETTGLVQVKLAGAPNDTTNILIGYYYLFYTGTVFRAISEDPEDSATTVRDWQPRIRSYPGIFQSIDNVLSGVFTINNTDITLINHDKEFQNYLTDEDSFFNKDIDIWLCINDESNIQKIFKGVIKKVTSSQNTVTLACADIFQKFKSKATMGDSTDEIYFTVDGFPNVVEKDRDKPCPFIFGHFSRWTSYLRGSSTGGSPDDYVINDGNEAVCTSAASVDPTTNRVWGACRIPGTLKMQSIGTIDDAVNISGFQGVKLSSYSNLYVGDTFKFNNGSDQYGTICHVGAFTFGGNPYDIMVDLTTALVSPGDTSFNLPSFSVMIKDPQSDPPVPLFYDRDYTVSTSVTSGGNNYVEITFVNNFESVFTFGNLDPNRHIVKYRTSNTATLHGDALEQICQLVGLDTEPTSFADANSDLPVNVQFAIPNFDEQDYEPYLKYVQEILASTLGFLKINSDFEVEYHLLETPVSTDSRPKSLTITDATFADIEYQDIITQFIAYNPHNSAFQATSVSPSPSETRTSEKARLLHGIENISRFRHVLETITDRVDAIAGLKAERFLKYKFATATQDIDSEINTDVQFENDIILGLTKTKDIKIISIDKSPKLISIEASDLKGL